MAVSLLDLKRENQPLLEQVQKAWAPLLENSQFVLGNAVSSFEEHALKYLELSDDYFALGVSSGTDALLMALMLLELEPGSEVVTTPFTFFATAGCIERAGYKIRFSDIEEKSFNIDPALLSSGSFEKVKAVVPVHLYGQTSPMKEVMQVANSRGWYVIEDAAQAIGAKFENRQAGAFGHMTAYSFYPTKNLGAFGDAGLVVGEKKYYEKAQRVRVHGMKDRYEHLEVGGNFRIDALQAAVLDIKLNHLAEWHERRRKNAAAYTERFKSSGVDKTIALPEEMPGCYHTYNQYVIRVPGKRDELKKFLDEKQIGNLIYYPTPLHTQPCFSHLGYIEGEFPVAEKACKEVLALPIYPFLEEKELETVVDAINSFFN